MKNISIWINNDGNDECVWKGDRESFNNKVLGEIVEVVDWLEGWGVDEFDVECKGKGWKMLSNGDGCGVLICDVGMNINKVYDEYLKKMGMDFGDE